MTSLLFLFVTNSSFNKR